MKEILRRFLAHPGAYFIEFVSVEKEGVGPGGIQVRLVCPTKTSIEKLFPASQQEAVRLVSPEPGTTPDPVTVLPN